MTLGYRILLRIPASVRSLPGVAVGAQRGVRAPVLPVLLFSFTI